MLLCCLIPACRRPAEDESFRRIELSVLEDKIRGGWAGQMIGVSYGAPTEFQYLGRLVPEEKLVRWTPDLVANALGQDDLYVDITLASVLEEHGLDATTEDFGEFFREAGYSLWHANLAARRALRRGVPATASGTPEHNVHANDIDFQIESDFIGLMTPGLPQASNELCERAGRVMNHGDGLYGGMFVSAMYGAAFFEIDPRRIVETGLSVLPPKSPYALLIGDVLTWSAEHPEDWIRVWQLVDERWNRREPCSEGALTPFNIDAKLNGAYVALGLLYGGGDFAQTMRVATRAGQDSDCNPATAAGVLGVVLGYDGIPGEYTSGLDAIADAKFSHTEATFRTIVADTVRRAIDMVERHGGRRDRDVLLVKTQPAVPATLALWDDYGTPVERIPIDDGRWSWRGDWQERTVEKWGSRFSSWASARAGSEASIRFEGTGVIVAGWYLPSGGLADVYLNGELVKTVDTYPDEDDVKFNEAVWHSFGLEEGEHEVRLVVRGEPYAESRGTEICLTELVVFRHVESVEPST
ncbi:MAG: ADP-ribosylglycohydrolase family protein [Planctomycetota bacterium]